MLRILVVGCGHMGCAHAKAYQMLDGFDLVGLVNRRKEPREALAHTLKTDVPTYGDFYQALDAERPDAVSINSYTSTHAPYAIAALERGMHVFVEKPLGCTPEEAQSVVDTAKRADRKLVVGYILRHHPSWIRFVDEARKLGSPLVMRMNLNQQSSAHKWLVHKNLLETHSPIVDCGVHYIDVMCQMTQSQPTWVSAIAARLSDEIAPNMTNYGHIQVRFENGSIGWFECGWGPMMSETAAFIKDVIGPRGSVSIVSERATRLGASAEYSGHTSAEMLRIHHSALQPDGTFQSKDEFIDLSDSPNHLDLCKNEQEFFLKAIQQNLDLSAHHQAAVESLRVVFAADSSLHTRRPLTCKPQS